MSISALGLRQRADRPSRSSPIPQASSAVRHRARQGGAVRRPRVPAPHLAGWCHRRLKRKDGRRQRLRCRCRCCSAAQARPEPRMANSSCPKLLEGACTRAVDVAAAETGSAYWGSWNVQTRSQSGGLSRRALITNAAGAALAAPVSEARAERRPVGVGYLRWTERRPTISLLDKPAADDGLAGAQLAISDNNTTGRFIGQQFALIDAPVRESDDPVDTFGTMVPQGNRLVADGCSGAAASGGWPALPVLKGVTLFNIARAG